MTDTTRPGTDINDLPVLEIAAKVVEHNDYLVAIDALLNGDERVMGKLAAALLAATDENERMRAVYEAAIHVVDERRATIMRARESTWMCRLDKAVRAAQVETAIAAAGRGREGK
jgi:hypothetical protein